jgi:hypothetical protein
MHREHLLRLAQCSPVVIEGDKSEKLDLRLTKFL